MSVVIVGSIGIDSIKTPFGHVKDVIGGSAVHASMAASFYTQVNLVGVVGKDFPKMYTKLLEKRGIDLQGLKVEKGKTFRWDGFYEFDMNQAHSIRTDLNVYASFKPKVPATYRSSPFLFLANIDPDLQKSVLSQMKKPRFIMMDTMNFWIQNKRDSLLDILKKVDLVLMNDGEVRELTGIPGLIKAGRKLLSMGVKMLVIKKGEHGALLLNDGMHFAAPSYPLENVKDPTGAGDSFAGGLVGYLAKTGDLSQENIRRAVIVGTVMASFNVEDFSLNRMKSLTQKEIVHRFEDLRHISLFEMLSLSDWV